LLQQLVGAILNHAANGMPLPIDPVTGYDIITAGHNAFSGDDADEMTRVKGLLEDYNMSGDDLSFPAGLPPQGKATPQESKKLAKDGGIEFWDSPLFTT